MHARLTLPFLLLLLSLAVLFADQEGRDLLSFTRTAGADMENDMSATSTRYSKSGFDITPLARSRVDELSSGLDPEVRRITQNRGTEPAFCGLLLNTHEVGIYTCAVCGLPIFRSQDKYDSGTGWPSFFQTFDHDHVTTLPDESHGMVRNEILCAHCGAHLGHVFDDGPAPSGLRYCLNSVALVFLPKGNPLPAQSRPAEVQDAWFGGGCFWGIEDAFAQLPGVVDAESGYSGGWLDNPGYGQVCAGSTGHAETVHVRFDPARIPYEDLVRFFFRIHDPTTMNRQGPDIGEQYRSVIFTADESQRAVVDLVETELIATDAFDGRSIATVVEPFKAFFRAEDYHQDYNAKHGRSCRIPAL